MTSSSTAMKSIKSKQVSKNKDLKGVYLDGLMHSHGQFIEKLWNFVFILIINPFPERKAKLSIF
jgi:hypothetical protein